MRVKMARGALTRHTAMRAIDLFAGWGGFTAGAEAAGVEVVWTADHWPLAVQAHAANHPGAEHVCQDLRQADWGVLPDFDLLLASPACQGHSQASQPKRRRCHDALRATAWAVVDCVEVARPRAFVVENVPDFARWDLFDLWRAAMERLGYSLAVQVVNAADHAVPQLRKRLFVVGTLGGARWVYSRPATPVPAFGPCIEWGEGKWRPVAGATPRVRERIAAARERHGARFLTQHVTGHKGIPLSQPIRTITCQDQWAVVDDDRYRPLTVRETARAMGLPDSYVWPAGSSRRDTIKGLGNAVPPPVARDLVRSVARAVACR